MKAIIGFLRYEGEITVGGFPNKSPVLSTLVQVLLYVLASTHAAVRRFLRAGIYALIMLIAAGYFLTLRRSGAYRLADYKGRAATLFDRFELTDKKKKFGDELSKGMQQNFSPGGRQPAVCVAYEASVCSDVPAHDAPWDGGFRKRLSAVPDP